MLDEINGRLGSRQREEGEDLAKVAPELLAEALDRRIDVAGDQRVGESPGLAANRLVIHAAPSLRCFDVP